MFVPPYFEFVNSAKLLAGEYALENIPSEMRLLGSSRPMILSDSTLEKIGTVSVLIQALSKGGMKPSAVYTDIPLDSSIEKVNEISAIYRENNADGIIAIGGGSVIDTAKGLKMLISQGGRDIMNYAGSEMLGRGQSVPFTAIPTTSGTGSEATGVAVIKDGENPVTLDLSNEMVSFTCGSDGIPVAGFPVGIYFHMYFGTEEMEIESLQWIPLDELCKWVEREPEAFTVWFSPAFKMVREQLT